MSALEDFEGVAIHDPNHFALILSDNDSRRARQERAEQNEEPQSRNHSQPHEGLNRSTTSPVNSFSHTTCVESNLLLHARH